MKTFTATLTGLATASLFAATAHAADMSETDTMTKQSRTVQTVKTIDADGEVSMKTVEIMPNDTRRTAVMSALAVQNTDSYIVADDNGDLYINHLLPISELPDPTLEVETIETYTVEYRGMTFTNKIVNED